MKAVRGKQENGGTNGGADVNEGLEVVPTGIGASLPEVVERFFGRLPRLGVHFFGVEDDFGQELLQNVNVEVLQLLEEDAHDLDADLLCGHHLVLRHGLIQDLENLLGVGPDKRAEVGANEVERFKSLLLNVGLKNGEHRNGEAREAPYVVRGEQGFGGAEQELNVLGIKEGA